MNRFSHEIPDRAFMKALLKHTGIALALLVPLAAYSTFSHAETGIPTTNTNEDSMNITAPTSIDSVDLNKYAGQWYEIARLDFKHEKGMDNVTAEYYLNDNGTVRVINRGYDFINEKWKKHRSKIPWNP